MSSCITRSQCFLSRTWLWGKCIHVCVQMPAVALHSWVCFLKLVLSHHFPMISPAQCHLAYTQIYGLRTSLQLEVVQACRSGLQKYWMLKMGYCTMQLCLITILLGIDCCTSMSQILVMFPAQLGLWLLWLEDSIHTYTCSLLWCLPQRCIHQPNMLYIHFLVLMGLTGWNMQYIIWLESLTYWCCRLPGSCTATTLKICIWAGVRM